MIRLDVLAAIFVHHSKESGVGYCDSLEVAMFACFLFLLVS